MTLIWVQPHELIMEPEIGKDIFPYGLTWQDGQRLLWHMRDHVRRIGKLDPSEFEYHPSDWYDWFKTEETINSLLTVII